MGISFIFMDLLVQVFYMSSPFAIRVVLPRPQVIFNEKICGPYQTNYINDVLNCATQYKMKTVFFENITYTSTPF